MDLGEMVFSGYFSSLQRDKCVRHSQMSNHLNYNHNRTLCFWLFLYPFSDDNHGPLGRPPLPAAWVPLLVLCGSLPDQGGRRAKGTGLNQ